MLPQFLYTNEVQSLTNVGVENELSFVGRVLNQCVDDLSAEKLVPRGLLWSIVAPRNQHRAQVANEIVKALAPIVLLYYVVGDWFEPVLCIG